MSWSTYYGQTCLQFSINLVLYFPIGGCQIANFMLLNCGYSSQNIKPRCIPVCISNAWRQSPPLLWAVLTYSGICHGKEYEFLRLSKLYLLWYCDKKVNQCIKVLKPRSRGGEGKIVLYPPSLPPPARSSSNACHVVQTKHTTYIIEEIKRKSSLSSQLCVVIFDCIHQRSISVSNAYPNTPPGEQYYDLGHLKIYVRDLLSFTALYGRVTGSTCNPSTPLNFDCMRQPETFLNSHCFVASGQQGQQAEHKQGKWRVTYQCRILGVVFYKDDQTEYLLSINQKQGSTLLFVEL